MPRAMSLDKPSNPAVIAGAKANGGAAARGQSKTGSAKSNVEGRPPAPMPATAKTRSARVAAQQRRVAGEGPRYGEGLRFDTPGLRYAADPVPTPPTPPEGAKVALDLASRTDVNVAAFAEAHTTAMDGNPNFPDPVPNDADFAFFLTDFEGYLSKMENLKIEMKNLTEQKDRSRAALSAALTQRAQYVEMKSNGNPDVIATSGLPLRKSRTPVGQLPWPQNLKVEQSQIVGELIVKWAAVSKARGYLLQCAEVVADKPREWANVYTGGKATSAQKPLTPGKTYEFRVAAIGGSTGQSEFSPVVSRMAA